MSYRIPESRELKEWLDKLELLNPNHIELGLDRSRAVLERMNLSFEGKIITVAGTNGKGTTVALLERLLRDKGYSTGAYTSPHLFHFRERIRIKGIPATDTQLIVAFEAVEAARQSTQLTYFEFGTLAAAYLFSQSQLDFWLLEVGLGGRLDAVNLFEPDVAVVTNIGLDHQNWLGETRELIGTEKAGIYRTGKPALFGALDRPCSIDQAVEAAGARPLFAGQHFGIKGGKFWWHNPKQPSLPVNLNDSIAPEVLATVLAVMAEFGWMPSEEEFARLQNFAVPGRFQTIRTEYYDLIVDVAHNQDSVALLAERLRKRKYSKLTAVVGFMQDKLETELVEPMTNVVDQWILVRPATPRAASLESIERTLVSAGVPKKKILLCPSLTSLGEILKGTDTALIYGSFYTVGQCLSSLGVEVG